MNISPWSDDNWIGPWGPPWVGTPWQPVHPQWGPPWLHPNDVDRHTTTDSRLGRIRGVPDGITRFNGQYWYNTIARNENGSSQLMPTRLADAPIWHQGQATFNATDDMLWHGLHLDLSDGIARNIHRRISRREEYLQSGRAWRHRPWWHLYHPEG
ncbi:MAG: hypothetical protein M1828_001947 [Chrysothrix sp. TS-e1954]|nr:MAG: hypothetical protein M1828_001947 [Chrysothrix sp. TS-e1954]